MINLFARWNAEGMVTKVRNDERAAIVAWLRKAAEAADSEALSIAAEVIEGGHHLPAKGK